MSGYLRRIVAVAGGVQPRLHPFVDSRYAPVRREENAGPVVIHEEMTAAAPTTLLDTLRKVEKPQDEPAAESVVPREVRRKLQREVPLAQVNLPRRGEEEWASGPRKQSEESKPLLPQQTGHEPELEVTARATVKAVKASEYEQPSPKAIPMISGGEDRAGAAGTVKVWSFQPLIESSEAALKERVASAESSLSAPRRNAPAMPRAGTAARRTAAESGMTRRQAETQAGDIQIHIGRIEVTAVHPPAPRPAPVPARRTMSLDEYLRGSGNSGRP
jgi:hypothetical protein